MQPPIVKAMRNLGHVVFETGNYNLNLFGIRDARDPDTYNDLLGCVCKVNGHWRVFYWHGTTDPGARYLKKPMKGTTGTASLVPGQYRGVYVIGPLGQTDYNALVQHGGEVAVFRDSNLDMTHDFEDSTIERGYFGINIHAPVTNPYNRDVDRTNQPGDGASAGCQVHATTSGFLEMMELCKRQIHEGHGTKFSYTLMLLEDVMAEFARA